ncbi:FAD-binding oxidoreductase [Georgenia sp. Z1491]|uniref:FAD-binding oxidoreductase n=1 Tax=Georgenia sp. Z1491 TaxID=3416707 RepID=UPI003CEFE624
MTEVQHQKWWGWGVEGVTFTHDNKPNFAPFVLDKVGLDLSLGGTPPPRFEDLEVPAPRLPDALADELRAAVGETHVVTGDMERVVHTYGKGISDLVRVRAGDLPRVPDVVVYPGDEDEVRAVVDLADAADAVIIPFGGGSNISGSLTPEPGETRPVVSLDMGRMNKVLEIDETSGLARVQAGVLGPDLEEQLGARGWTSGHQPDSFRHSTLGGWVATRSSGMQSDRYGDIADITRGLRSVLPGRVVSLRPLPSTSTGPSVREMIIGSEGRLGVITEVWIHVHRLPEKRLVVAYLYQSWGSALEAMREISTSDVHPSITRVSDPAETQFSLSTQKAQTGIKGKISTGIFDLLARRGWDLDQVCLSYVGYEGSPKHVAYQRRAVGRIVGRHGGIPLGTGPGALYDQKKFDTPYIRDFLLDMGALADVSETAAPWARLRGIYERTVTAARATYDALGVRGYIMCHLSHSYHSGACLYFTFAFPADDADGAAPPLEQYWQLKSAIQQSFIDGGGTLSHHHGVGTDHAPWMEADISEAGVELMVGLLGSADPHRRLNPGTLLPAHREW